MRINLRFLILLGGLAVPGWCAADLTLTGYSTLGSMGMPMSSQERIMISGSQVRRDFVDHGRAYSDLFDLDKKTVAVVDHGGRTVETYNLNTLRPNIEGKPSETGLKLSLEPMGEKLPLMKWQCEKYKITASMPARLGNEDTIFHLQGEIWLAKGVPEQAQVKELVKIAKQPDFFLAVPSVARLMPAQAEAMSEIVRKMSTRGLPCSGDAQVSYEGNGPMANLARRMATKLGFSFNAYSTDSIASNAFEIPTGFLLLNRQAPTAVMPNMPPRFPGMNP